MYLVYRNLDSVMKMSDHSNLKQLDGKYKGNIAVLSTLA